MLLGIMLSLSRMGFVASLCSLFVAGSLALGVHAQAGRRLATIVLVGAALIAASLYVVPDRLISRFAEVGESPANLEQDARPRVWKDARALVADYSLVGCGLGAFEQAFSRYRTFLPERAIDTLHNDYLQFLAELGGIGFVVAGSGMTALFISAARAALRNPGPSARYIAIGSCAALVSILIHSFTDYNLYIPANAMLLAWIGGIVSSLNFGSNAFTH
jgi:O-antigen ligase